MFAGSGARDGCIPALGQRGFLDEVLQPTRVDLDGEKVAALAAGAYHSVVLTRTARVLTFGAAQLGQLGRTVLVVHSTHLLPFAPFCSLLLLN